MVRITPQARALVGRLATPAPEKLGGRVEDKAKDFFREVGQSQIHKVFCMKASQMYTGKFETLLDKSVRLRVDL